MTRLLLLLTFAAAAASAQVKMTSDELERFVKSAVQLHQNDREVAKYLGKVKLTTRLTDQQLDEIRGANPSPRILDAVRVLKEASADLPAPVPVPARVSIDRTSVPPPPAPSSEEQAKVLAETREYALSYVRKLPDFICAQITRRYFDPTGREDFRLADKINEQLTFFDQKESYKVSSINDRFVTVSHDQLDGASSSGEFGSMLKEIFEPKTETDFQWERWATLRGRRMHVYSFRVSQARSQYRIVYRRAQQVVAGYRGLIYVDRDSGAVMRIKLTCENMPLDFPIQDISLDLNYDFQKLSDVEFILPYKAELRSREGNFLVKNEVEFRLYRKFGADATIKFDAIDPIPEDATKEQPVTPPPSKPEPVKPKPEPK
ncbi:MAG: hypothetical protein ABI823_04755 [Bryobacteraceae bacterium]